jgi:hypothetical protein
MEEGSTLYSKAAYPKELLIMEIKSADNERIATITEASRTTLQILPRRCRTTRFETN